MKYKIFFSVIAFSALCMFLSCEDEKTEDLTQAVNKNGAVETSVTVQHADSLHDILLTKHTIWYKGSPYKNVEYRDTVPSLGMENTTKENSNGDEENVVVKKDYEIFITVK